MENHDWLTNYINAIYYSVITMLTIGYGDITPVTNVEKIYIILFAFIACGIFAYSINSIGIIVQDFSKNNK